MSLEHPNYHYQDYAGAPTPIMSGQMQLFMRAGFTDGGSTVAIASRMLVEPDGVSVGWTDGGVSASLSQTWAWCDAVIVARDTCGDLDTHLYQYTGGSELGLYDGTEFVAYAAESFNGDGGVLPAGDPSVCNAAPVCGGLWNHASARAVTVSPATEPTSGSASAPPNSGVYRLSDAPVVYGDASFDGGTVQAWTLELSDVDPTDGGYEVGTFRLAYAIDEGLSTRATGTFAITVSGAGDTLTFAPTCPAGAAIVAGYSGGYSDMTLELPAGAFGIAAGEHVALSQ